MFAVIDVDEFIIDQCSKVVTLLHDWCFITQAWVERGIMATFGMVCLVDIILMLKAHHSIGLEICADSVVLIGMWMEYKETRTQREARRTGSLGRWHRIFGLALLPVAVLTALTAPHSYYVSMYASMTTLWLGFNVLMAYVTILDTKGQRGKRTRTSLERMKEMFENDLAPQRGLA